jgi:hypothetical protein
MPIDKPIYPHYCDSCIYLGRSEDDYGKECDLYVCTQGMGSNPTVIARYGEDGPEYISGIIFADQNRAIAQALILAVGRGLLHMIPTDKLISQSKINEDLAKDRNAMRGDFI